MRLVRPALLALMGACLPPPEREPDPWERYAQAPVPPGNVRVRVEAFEFAAEDRAAFDLALRYRDPSIAVSAGRLGGPNGLTLFAATGNFLAAFRAESRRYRSRRETTQSLLVAEGAEGSFQSVERRAAPAAVVIPVYDGAVVVRTIRTEGTGSGMAVRPRPLPDGRLEIELTPWLASREGGGIRLTELSTRVAVRPGTPVVLLSADETSETLGTALLGLRSSAGLRRTLLVLVAER